MSHAFIISPLEKTDLKTNAGYFADELNRQWPNSEVHFVSDPNAHSVLQWKIITNQNDNILGDLYGEQSVSLKGGNRSDIIQFALWFRTIIPHVYKLFLYKDDLSHQPIELTSETTEADIISGFSIPFDLDWKGSQAEKRTDEK